MVRAEDIHGNIQRNRYDAEGLRYEMEENERLFSYVYDGREIITEETGQDTIRYIRGYELISSDSERARTYYHYAADELGSITHVVNGIAKEIENVYEYDSFGNTTHAEEKVHNPFRYTAQQYAPLAGLYYLRARFYNPATARFTQEDSYYGDGLNLYVYCRNNPVNYYDPEGHAECWVETAKKASKQLKSGKTTEVYYRTMSQSDYDYLRMTGELPATGETFISPTKAFSSDYNGVMVRFELNDGTTSMLEKIGLSNGDRAPLAKAVYPNMSYVSGVKWTENFAFFKAEGSQINIGLGKGKALEIYNSNISTFKKVEY